ncbi:hypothetical protein DFH07DRAFT_861231, partial [Mycena maculata]
MYPRASLYAGWASVLASRLVPGPYADAPPARLSRRPPLESTVRASLHALRRRCVLSVSFDLLRRAACALARRRPSARTRTRTGPGSSSTLGWSRRMRIRGGTNPRLHRSSRTWCGASTSASRWPWAARRSSAKTSLCRLAEEVAIWSESETDADVDVHVHRNRLLSGERRNGGGEDIRWRTCNLAL